MKRSLLPCAGALVLLVSACDPPAPSAQPETSSAAEQSRAAAATGTDRPGAAAAAAEQQSGLPVNVDNFKRVESDLYFAKFVADGAFGKFTHAREPVSIDDQDVIRMNRDTLYSTAVVDLASSDATVTIPDASGRFMALQVINEDHYTPAVVYDPGPHTFTQEQVGTRYATFLVRTFVDPGSEEDLAEVHRLQDALRIVQSDPGEFSVPVWDTAAAARIREALNALAAANGGVDSARMFGTKDKVDPVQHLLGTAGGWGGNPVDVAFYSGGYPTAGNEGLPHELTVASVPVDGFWSVSVYNKDGFFEKNALDAYSVNNVTAKKNDDGSVTVRFGDCDGQTGNCIPTSEGWNYLVRLYRPRPEILNGSWTFPVPTPIR